MRRVFFPPISISIKNIARVRGEWSLEGTRSLFFRRTVTRLKKWKLDKKKKKKTRFPNYNNIRRYGVLLNVANVRFQYGAVEKRFSDWFLYSRHRKYCQVRSKWIDLQLIRSILPFPPPGGGAFFVKSSLPIGRRRSPVFHLRYTGYRRSPLV